MTCKEVRVWLTGASGTERPAGIDRHLAGCSACRRYAGRVQAAQQLFREHHAGVSPDPAFAGRVIAGIDGRPAEILGWVAARMLPATLVLVLVLAWFALRTAPDFAEYQEPATNDDLWSWVLEEPGEER